MIWSIELGAALFGFFFVGGSWAALLSFFFVGGIEPDDILMVTLEPAWDSGTLACKLSCAADPSTGALANDLIKFLDSRSYIKEVKVIDWQMRDVVKKCKLFHLHFGL